MRSRLLGCSWNDGSAGSTLNGVDYGRRWSDQQYKRRTLSLFVTPALFIAALIAAGLWVFGLGHHRPLSKLVLQSSDLGPDWAVAATNSQRAPTAGSGAGYEVSYRRHLGGNDLYAAPVMVYSFVYRARTPAGARVGLTEFALYADRRVGALRGRPIVSPTLGDERQFYGRAPHPPGAASRPRAGFYMLVWRSGNTVAGLEAIGFEAGLRADTVNLARVMQNRIGGGT